VRVSYRNGRRPGAISHAADARGWFAAVAKREIADTFLRVTPLKHFGADIKLPK